MRDLGGEEHKMTADIIALKRVLEKHPEMNVISLQVELCSIFMNYAETTHNNIRRIEHMKDFVNQQSIN